MESRAPHAETLSVETLSGHTSNPKAVTQLHWGASPPTPTLATTHWVGPAVGWQRHWCAIGFAREQCDTIILRCQFHWDGTVEIPRTDWGT